LACLARPSWILWPVLLIGVMLLVQLLSLSLAKLNRPPSMLLSWQTWLVYLMGLVLAMSPWWYRNYLLTDRFVPTTLQVGASLYDGWHPGASGASDEGMAFTQEFQEALRLQDSQLSSSDQRLASSPGHDTFEWRLNRAMLDAAWNWASENRSDAWRLALVKFAKMWNPWPTAKELGGSSVRVAEALMYSLIMLFASVGLWLNRRELQLWIFALPVFYFATLHMVFPSSVRYRQPAVLVLCVVGGIGAAWMLDQINLRRRQSKTGKL
jgi:hypothetical protein